MAFNELDDVDFDNDALLVKTGSGSPSGGGSGIEKCLQQRAESQMEMNKLL